MSLKQNTSFLAPSDMGTREMDDKEIKLQQKFLKKIGKKPLKRN